MICKNCGKEITNDKKFCIFCGEKVSISSNPSTYQQEKKNHSKRPIFLPIVLVLIVAIILYFIFIDKREIDQDVLVSSVVNVLCENGEEVSGGSGTIISTDGIILTNSHVIPQDEESVLTPEYGCIVILPNLETGKPERIYYANPIVLNGLSDDYDLAFLEVYGVYTDEEGLVYGEFPTVFPSIFADENKHDYICQSRTHKLGDSIRIFGYPQTSGGYYLTITDGVISSFSDEGLIFTSAEIDAGNSGGLAVDEKGCMVGVPVAVSEGVYENMGIIISTDLLLEFYGQLDTFLE